ASISTASTKLRWLIFCTKEITSPPSPQPKQCQWPSWGRMLKEGVFSSWKGHSPCTEPMPAVRSVTCSETTSSRRERSRTSSTFLIRPLATASQLRCEARQGRVRGGDVGDVAVEQLGVQAPRGDVRVGGD